MHQSSELRRRKLATGIQRKLAPIPHASLHKADAQADLIVTMRTSLRLLARGKPGTFLEANTPTGLTGLTTHPAPRPALILTYRQTLEKLQQLPATSVYCQSTEALTRHRLSIVESSKPAGYDEWLSRIRSQISANPEAYRSMKQSDGSYAHGRVPEERSEVWDGVVNRKSALDTGNFTEQAASERGRKIQDEVDIAEKPELPTVDDLEAEPPLDAAQIDDIENKIGAGLIEEVLQVAEGELVLAGEMVESRAWESLEEQPAEGQWRYHERPNPV